MTFDRCGKQRFVHDPKSSLKTSQSEFFDPSE